MALHIHAALLVMLLSCFACSCSGSTVAVDAAAATSLKICTGSTAPPFVLSATAAGDVNSPLQTATAFVVDQGAAELVICAVSDGTFTACNTTKLDLDGATPLEAPADVAVFGDKLYITEASIPARIRACSWSGLSVTSCYVSDLERKYQRADGIVLDTLHGVLYFASVGSSAVVACRNTSDVSSCKEVDLGPSGKVMQGPVSVAISHGSTHLWVTAENGVHRCAITASGEVDTPTCSRKQLPFSPYGIALVPGTSVVLMAEADSGRMYRCTDEPLPSDVAVDCTPTHGEGTLYNRTAPEGQENNFPAVVAMDVSGSVLYVPTFFGGGVAVCRDAAKVSMCSMQSGANHSFKHLTSIRVVPVAAGSISPA